MCIVVVKMHINCACASMPDNIAQTFLRDPEDGEFRSVVQEAGAAGYLEINEKAAGIFLPVEGYVQEF